MRSLVDEGLFVPAGNVTFRVKSTGNAMGTVALYADRQTPQSKKDVGSWKKTVSIS